MSDRAGSSEASERLCPVARLRTLTCRAPETTASVDPSGEKTRRSGLIVGIIQRRLLVQVPDENPVRRRRCGQAQSVGRDRERRDIRQLSRDRTSDPTITGITEANRPSGSDLAG